MSTKPYIRKTNYYETDQMGVIHHSNYIRYFEEARIDFMDQLGLGYRELEEAGIIIPCVNVSCQYKKMVHFGDTIEVHAKVTTYNGVKLIVSYEIINQTTGELSTTGESTHCFIDKEGKLLSLKKCNQAYHEMFLNELVKEDK